MSSRNIESLVRRIREEMRIEGADGAGISDWIIDNGINAAIEDLGEVFPIRDVMTLTTTAGENAYTLDVDNILNIGKLEYDGRKTHNISVSDYLSKVVKNLGSVDEWLLWGNQLILVGEIEADKEITLWITRTPKRLETKDDIPEVPSYADEAIVAYAISICYREQKDYNRADYHYGVYLKQKDNVLRRAVPQRQRDSLPKMSDRYWGPFRPTQQGIKSDTNPGGN